MKNKKLKNKKLKLPKIPVTTRKGVVGEAACALLFSGFAYTISVSKTDIGIDIFCELLVDDKPTGRFFFVQAKYHKNNPYIKQGTKNYWSLLDHPVFVLWIKNEYSPDKVTLEAIINDQKFIKEFPTKIKTQGDRKFIPYVESDFLNVINKYWDYKEKLLTPNTNDRKPSKSNDTLKLKKTKPDNGGFRISEFLSQLTEKLTEQKEIEDSERVRLYLFAAAQLYRINIPSEILGSHEINLIYTQKEKIQLTSNETILILRTVLSDKFHLKVGWYWLKRFKKEDVIFFLHHFILKDTSDEVVMGSLNLLSKLWEDKFIGLLEEPNRLLNENIKIQELEILENHPSKKTLDYCKRYLNDDSERVKNKANEVYIKLLSKLAPNDTVNYLVSSNSTYHKIDSVFLTKLSDSDLRRLQNIKDNYTRVDVIKNLVDRDSFSEDELLELIKDEDWNIRFLSIKGLITKGFNPTAEQIRTILWSKDSNALQTALSKRIYEFDDKELIISSYLKEDVQHLKDKLEWEYFGDDVYEAIGKKDPQFIIEARVDLINGFKNKKKSLIEKVAKTRGVTTTFLDNLNSKYEKSILSQFIAAGLRIILENGKSKDKHFAFKFINDENFIIQDIAKKILLKFANFDDIPALIDISKKDYSSKFIEKAFDLSRNKKKFIDQILNSTESRLIVKALSFANRHGVKVSNENLITLLKNKEDSVRKFTVVYMINNLSQKEYTKIISQYIKLGNYFYNVVSIFDLLTFSHLFLKKVFIKQFSEELNAK